MERPAGVEGELYWMIGVQSRSLPLSRPSPLVVLSSGSYVLVAERAVFG